MGRADFRRQKREEQKKKKTYVLTTEDIVKIRNEERIKAKKEALEKTEQLADDILKMMLVIPVNVLISDYWEKSAKKRIPKFVDDCLSLYENWINGHVSMEEMQKLTEEYADIKLIEPGSDVEKSMSGR